MVNIAMITVPGSSQFTTQTYTKGRRHKVSVDMLRILDENELDRVWGNLVGASFGVELTKSASS